MHRFQWYSVFYHNNNDKYLFYNVSWKFLIFFNVYSLYSFIYFFVFFFFQKRLACHLYGRSCCQVDCPRVFLEFKYISTRPMELVGFYNYFISVSTIYTSLQPRLLINHYRDRTVTGQNPPGQNPPGQNPPGQYPPGQNPPRTKSPRAKIPPDKIPPDKIPPSQNPPRTKSPRAKQNPINSLQK